MNLLIFGFGFSGKALAKRLAAKGWSIAATFWFDAPSTGLPKSSIASKYSAACWSLI